MKLRNLIIALSSLWALSAMGQDKRILVMSNLNVMSPELLVQEGSAFTEASKLSPFMLKQSSQIFRTMVDTVRKYRPDLILIPGDLTKCGELLSHQEVISTLDAMRQEGASVLVIPGEQDIDRSDAVSYNGNTTTPVASVTAEEFVELYKDYGYGETSQRDEQTLSYACEPFEGLVVFGIDLRPTEGAFSPETMAWLTAIADDAVEHGKQLIGMIHCNAIDHFKLQSDIATDCVVREWEETAHELVQHGLRLFFTGHQHVQDVAKFYIDEERTDSIIDVATGTLTMYPTPWRLFTVNEALTQWSGQTGYITNVPGIGNVKVLSKAHADNNFKNILHNLIATNWEPISRVLEENAESLERINITDIHTPQDLTNLAMNYLEGTFKKIIYAHLEGNEPKGSVSVEEMKSEIETAVDNLLSDRLGILQFITRMEAKRQIKELLESELYPGLISILTDTNQYGTSLSSVTDDLAPVITLPRSENRYNGLRTLPADYRETNTYFTLNGQRLQGTPRQKGIYVTANKKYLLR